ncbi:uncharacterized protein LOC110812368, partial [Carica papaya]|uniref:uncharacterized protein LOC110812368 n=1 Tax=Carica papaya TaxID=3649 RepID=UPI000B8CA7E9
MDSRDGDFDLDISRERKACQSSGQQASRSESSSRQHATRPEATPMDFVVRPQSKIDPEEVRARAKQIVQDQRRLKDSHDGICCPLNISSPETVAFLSKVAASSDPDQLEEATRNKTLAEVKFKDSNFKSALKHVKKAHRISPNMGGLSSMLTAFKILYVASKAAVGTACDWYKILQVEPFSHINTIKKQYKKLALVLHPDKNPHLGCEEAFKLVGEGFGVLSDRIKRKEYDMILRIRMQEERVNEVETTVVETFWTACSRCRLLHQFDKKYLGHNLVCPSCKRSFQAVEVESANGGDPNHKGSGHRERSKRLKRKVDGGEWFWNASLGNKVVREGLEGEDNGVGGSCEDKNHGSGKEFGGAGGLWAGGRLRTGG